MKIELSLDAEIEYEFEPAYQINVPDGTESIPATLTIFSVKCDGIELISLLSEDELSGLEQTILAERS